MSVKRRFDTQTTNKALLKWSTAMILILETNGKGFMGWIAELPGAFVRGATQEEVRGKVSGELAAYAKWLEIEVDGQCVLEEQTVATTAAVEDGDTSILLDADSEPYANADDLDHDCELMDLSAWKVQQIYDRCTNRDVVAPSKDRTTFYGPVHNTIDSQYSHIVNCQQYYLESIGIPFKVQGDLRRSRTRVVDTIRQRYCAQGNALYSTSDEEWTIRKVIRRIIWHDRIHARAISRMKDEVCT